MSDPEHSISPQTYYNNMSEENTIEQIPQQVVQHPEIPNFIAAFNTKEEVEDGRASLQDGAVLFFNPYYKISHKQKKQLNSVIFRNTGMKIEGNNQTFEYPEVFIDNIEVQKETLIILFWNTEQYWASNGAQGNYWITRPAESISADVLEQMFEQVQDKVDPLKTKKLTEKAKKQAENES